MTRTYPTLTLLTDLGSVDESAGVLRSIIRDLAPDVAINDLSHEIAPGDVRGASVMLARAVNYLPTGVVAVCVETGITSVHRCVAVQVAGGEGVLVGPDNGVLAPAVAMIGGAELAVVLDLTDAHLASPGAVWPARDIIVPVAAALCAGTALAKLGSPIDPGLLLPGVVPLSRPDGEQLIGDVLWIDRAGACQLNIDPAEVDGWGDQLTVTVGETRRTARRLDGAGPGGRAVDLPAGALGFLVDASGMVSVVAGQRRAAAELNAGVGDQVVLAPLDPADVPATATTVRLSPPRP